MKIATAEEMRKIDQRAIQEAGIPGAVLMENAGYQVVVSIKEMLGKVCDHRIVVVAGKGNNGGDGFVVARHLYNQGAKVNIILVGSRDEVRGDAAVNLHVITKMGIDLIEVKGTRDLNRCKVALTFADLIVDALLGTGVRGPVASLHGEVIKLINGAGKTVVAVDLPSGVDADTGKIHGQCVKARRTVTFALPKLGCFLYPGAGYVGELVVADIGIPCSFLTDPAIKANLIDAGSVRTILPQRRPTAHKGECGRVAVVAGSQGMGGAAALASTAALRAGAGLVMLGMPRPMVDALAAKLTEVIIKPLAETPEHTIDLAAAEAVLELAGKCDVLAIGPGLGTVGQTAEMVRSVLSKVDKPTVIDADALNALAGQLSLLARTRAPLVLTPHPGEAARLLGTTVQEVQEKRVETVKKLAQEAKATVVLKGAPSLIAEPQGNLFVNTTGNPGMATAGAGDVLTGLIAGLLAQGLSTLDAAIAGVYLHGLAGDLAAREKGVLGTIAGDIVENLPYAVKLLIEK